ncbi:MAG: transcription-repair coupling factor, partial [Candidatus Neomarinimicrobiota bacterium]
GEHSVCFIPDPESHKTYFTDLDSITIFFYNDAISKISSNINPVIISTVKGLSAKLPTPEFSRSNTIKLEVKKAFDRDLFIKTLFNFGYNREITVEYPLEFSVKGGIVDFYPPNSLSPYRVEFFDNVVESIRSFNVEDQLSIKQIGSLEVTPPANPNFKEKDTANILSYLSHNSIFITTHSESIVDYISNKDYLLPELSDYKCINLHDYIKSDIHFNIDYPVFSEGKLSVFRKHLSRIRPKFPNPLFYIICSNQNQSDRLKTLLGDLDLIIEEGIISHSIEFYDIGLYMYAEHDIFSRSRKTNTFQKLSRDIPIQHLEAESIVPGDIMVHINYGIGKYLGLDKVNAFGSVRECLSLEYRDGDKVYIPLERLKDVQKYKAQDGFAPVLNKLGTTEWERTKLKTRRSLEKITHEIIQLYAMRTKSVGFSFDIDSGLQIEMESEFIYDETPDQITATKEIKKDMEKPRPMDRLLCGDVGFGKTEVAIRAAFKAVTNSKQVAVLVPTTILADQHFITFSKRLQKYPINISLLSRFISKKSQNEILNGLANGYFDIVIGTHRLLSNDVKFKDLGLLIIDEEQRFGVKHKDKIKMLRTNIDILSLSATPIPRTLQFSLIGARDFSLINTPPKSRLPIYTEIITYDKGIISSAVYREISRGGQIYFVHNEIKSISSITSKLRDLCPDIRIRFAHGQMRERELESIMNDFINHNIDLLVTTTIIESGIDIPNVNTIFINRAHKMGLAQLYQLRGRVGRANRRAYAYLIVPHLSRLNEKAIKRLQTIQRYTSLGSGYSIATKDLEIRGAGNIFGLEQIGYIQSVGYDLYIKILRESFEDCIQGENREQNEKLKKIVKAEISYPYPAYFPESYI